MRKLAALGDIHIPYHDPLAVGVTLKFLRAFRPDKLIVMGDVFDFYQFSAFDRNPARVRSLQNDLDEARVFLNQLESAVGPSCERVYIEGNHEDRLRRYLWKRAPELASFAELELAKLLKLEERDWQFFPYHDPVNRVGEIGHRDGELLAVHGWHYRRHAGGTAKACFDVFGGSGLVGHCHHLGEYRTRRIDGQHVWWETGCLSTLRPEYRPFPDWHQGFVAGYIWGENDEHLDLRPVPIHDGRLLWQGRLRA